MEVELRAPLLGSTGRYGWCLHVVDITVHGQSINIGPSIQDRSFKTKEEAEERGRRAAEQLGLRIKEPT